MKYKCNIFKDVWDKSCSNVVKISTVLNNIQSGRWKDQVLAVREAKVQGDKDKVKNLKFALPAAIFSGVFEERIDDACVTYNKIMVIDIDEISDRRLVRLKDELLDNPWVYAYFDGPTKGIKILVFIDSELSWHKSHAFSHIEALFNELYGVQIDPSGKNPSRLCFVSYDPCLYINPEPYILHIEKDEGISQFRSINTSDYQNSVPSTDSLYILNLCVKWVKKSKVGGYHKGNRNNYVFSVACLMCEFGVAPEMTLNHVLSRYPSLGHKETMNAVASAYRRCRKDFGTKIANENRNSSQTSLL